jgi:CubicO group peptidase (beta-lactamase class C family)
MGAVLRLQNPTAWERACPVSYLAQRLAWTPATLPDGSSTRYGFGWFVAEDQGRVRLSHHGETSGFTNAIVKYPEQRLAVIVLTNRAGGEPWNLAQRLADLWLGTRETRAWPFDTMPNAR